jgi:hypothetical protein
MTMQKQNLVGNLAHNDEIIDLEGKLMELQVPVGKKTQVCLLY